MTNAKLTQDRRLKMRYSGGMVKHLGVQMYSGLVGAIAELVANAWDANATEVRIRVPFDQDWRDNATTFEVSDNGLGMTWEDCNDKFLVVGRDRRYGRGRERTPPPLTRTVMGRKGIGKLAPFGIANLIEIRTVKDNWVTHFVLDYEKIIAESGGELVSAEGYEPLMLEDRPTEEAPSTQVILSDLHLARRQTAEQFRISMARRFTILSQNFVIKLNETPLTRAEMPFQFRFPETPGAWQDENINGVGTITWWSGFTQEPIRDDEVRGFVILVNGKLAQAPFFFELSGGAYGQHGMQYMTGEVRADQLDEVERKDLIATDRSSIRWDDPMAAALLEWGQRKVKSLLSRWAERRSEDKIDNLRQKLGENTWSRLDRFPPSEQKEIMRAIRTFAQVPSMDDQRFAEIVDLLLRAYEDQNFMNMIRRLNALAVTDQDQIMAFLAEVNILEAVKMASIVQARVEVVRKLKELIDSGAPEKLSTAPMDMHTILQNNPWLIDPGWDVLQHEKSLDKVLIDHYGLDESETGDNDRRLDFFCLADSLRCVIVEVKRPGELAGKKEIDQVRDYVVYFRQRVKDRVLPPTMSVQGYLIIGRLRPNEGEYVEIGESAGITTVSWDDLWRRSERLYRDFLDLVKSKAPADDPRLVALNEME